MNVCSYVIMIAGAKHIAPSAVGLVYTANVLPSFLVKLTGPYWFHLVPYSTRILVAAVLMALSFLLVSLGQMWNNNLGLQLFGIVLGSIQSGFGYDYLYAILSLYCYLHCAVLYCTS
jgi:battenin